ncbi:MAG: hypothetical protein QMD36_04980 [Candidatus Aenigmarchaeota archaeon]|nr:hypothetical protein [Candidatus Aenigmarchaeota archaeon]
MDKQKLYEKGIKEAKKSYAIFENALFLLLIVLGFLGMYPLSIKGLPLVSILYALFGVVMLVFVLRKHLCTKCYYYDKWCHCGWGKLSSAIFKRDSGNQEFGGKLAGITWGILMGLPIIGMVGVIFVGKTPLIDVLIFFVPFIILVAINGVLHMKDCKECKMRFICPGSAAK